MRTISYRLEDLKKAIINIGFVGENEHTRVRIDASELYAEYLHAAASMTVQPPEGEAYPAIVTRDGNTVIWDVTDSDLTAEGLGEFQLAFTESETVAKTYIGRIKVARSIIPTGDIPSGIDDFLTRAGAALTAIPETIDAALQEAKESGEFDGPAGPAGQDGAPGADGYSPSASVSKSGSTATIVITDKNGTTSAQISDGTGADIIDDTAGAGDTDKTFSADKLLTEFTDLKSALTSMTVEEKLLRDELPGTSKSVTFDANDNPVSIVHSADGQTVRTDVFVWSTNTVTETRTASNKYITITTNLETLAQTISEVQEVA